MKTIPLTKRKVAIVDDEDYEWLNQHKWFARKSSKDHTYYAARKEKGGQISMHQEILKAPKGKQIDHVNHIALDNRKINLRTCTHSQNQQNQISRRGTSKFKGVLWYKWGKRQKRWKAEIRNNGRNIHIGYFNSEIEAAMAYDAKAKELFGEFACLNFPPELEG